MSAREQILSKIRSSLQDGPGEAVRRADAAAHIASHRRHPTPGRVAGKGAGELHALFKDHLEALSTTVISVNSDAEVPEALSEYLRSSNLPQTVRRGHDERLTQIPWSNAPTLELHKGRGEPRDEVGLSHAVAGVAETGTVVLTSGADNPVTLNFMPETHVVVVRAEDVVGPYEDALQRVRDRAQSSGLPRTINMISGPSANRRHRRTHRYGRPRTAPDVRDHCG